MSRVSRFLRAIFFNRASKVNIPTNLQPSESRLRMKARGNEERWRENDKKSSVEKESVFFSFPPEKLRFHRSGSPSFGSPHAYSYSSG